MQFEPNQMSNFLKLFVYMEKVDKGAFLKDFL